MLVRVYSVRVHLVCCYSFASQAPIIHVSALRKDVMKFAEDASIFRRKTEWVDVAIHPKMPQESSMVIDRYALHHCHKVTALYI
jgi:hypothetical protein